MDEIDIHTVLVAIDDLNGEIIEIERYIKELRNLLTTLDNTGKDQINELRNILLEKRYDLDLLEQYAKERICLINS